VTLLVLACGGSQLSSQRSNLSVGIVQSCLQVGNIGLDLRCYCSDLSEQRVDISWCWCWCWSSSSGSRSCGRSRGCGRSRSCSIANKDLEGTGTVNVTIRKSGLTVDVEQVQGVLVRVGVSFEQP